MDKGGEIKSTQVFYRSSDAFQVEAQQSRGNPGKSARAPDGTRLLTHAPALQRL
jgi:hypothetical protein